MKPLEKKEERILLPRICLMVIGVFVFLSPAFVLALSSEETDSDYLSNFKYVLENRADPFQPFISEKSSSSEIDLNEIIDSEEPLTGMQLFEPGQLTLVALMNTGERKIAMVEDFTGKGYILTEGTKIGRRGIVTGIVPNSVIIEETARTRAGKEIVTKVVMTMKKEEKKE